MTSSDDTALAGYHMYFAPPLVSPSGNAAPMRGPLSDDTGRALVISPGVELDPQVYPELIPGRYLLVPVDARGRELPHLQRIERQIVDNERSRLMQAVTAEATMLVMAAAVKDPKLATGLFDLLQSGDKQGLVFHAMQRAGQEIWGGPVPDAPLDEETRRRLVRMTADKLSKVCRASSPETIRNATVSTARASMRSSSSHLSSRSTTSCSRRLARTSRTLPCELSRSSTFAKSFRSGLSPTS
jgi:hypothetical protein